MAYHKKNKRRSNRAMSCRFSAREKQPIMFRRFFCSAALAVLMLFCGSVWNEAAIADSGHSSKFFLSGSNESWTKKWIVEDSALNSPEGLKAGFHRRLPPNLNLKLPGGKRGMVCIYPESRYKPARMVSRKLKITNENIVMVTNVAAARYPRGRWEFVLKLKDFPFTDPIIINGKDGWQDMEFDLSSYKGLTVDIEIEARMIGSGRNSSVFIDYIVFTGLDRKKPSDLTLRDNNNPNKPFDEEYLMFLGILRRKEEFRHYRLMDQNYLDSIYYPSGRKIKKTLSCKRN